jgi:hypothetical protein
MKSITFAAQTKKTKLWHTLLMTIASHAEAASMSVRQKLS